MMINVPERRCWRRRGETFQLRVLHQSPRNLHERHVTDLNQKEKISILSREADFVALIFKPVNNMDLISTRLDELAKDCRIARDSVLLVPDPIHVKNVNFVNKEYAMILWKGRRPSALHRDESHTETFEDIVIRLAFDLSASVGGILWSLAIALPIQIGKDLGREKLKGMNVLVLGAGLGFEGFALAAWGANVTLTDLNQVLPVLNRNQQLNRDMFSSDLVCVRELVWGEKGWAKWMQEEEQQRHYDLILGCELVYNDEVLDDLLFTIKQVVKHKAVLYLAMEERYFSCLQFPRELALQTETVGMNSTALFDVEEIEDFERCGCDDGHMFRVKRKQ